MVAAFQPVAIARGSMRVSGVVDRHIRWDKPVLSLSPCRLSTPQIFRLYNDKNNDGNGQDEVQQQNNFDGKGFAGYLAPYAIAAVASVAVTAAFLKFVLMDY
jgi:hypothetical protein